MQMRVDEGTRKNIISTTNSSSFVHPSSSATLFRKIESPPSHTHANTSYMTCDGPSSTCQHHSHKYYFVARRCLSFLLPPLFIFRVHPTSSIFGHTRPSHHPTRDPLIHLLSHTTSTTYTHIKNIFIFCFSSSAVHRSHILLLFVHTHICVEHTQHPHPTIIPPHLFSSNSGLSLTHSPDPDPNEGPITGRFHHPLNPHKINNIHIINNFQ